MEKTLYGQGMPCHKYILRNLANQDEAHVFLKDFVITMQKADFSEKEIENMFLGLSVKVNFKFDFTTWPYDMPGYSRVNSICMAEEVAHHKYCYQLYKNYDKKTPACSLCPLSVKYQCANEHVEHILTQYAMLSEEHLLELTEKGISPDQFTSVNDILSLIVSDRCYTYPFLKYTFLALTEGVRGKSNLLEYHIKRMRKFKLPSVATLDNLIAVANVLFDSYFTEEEVTLDPKQASAAIDTLTHPKKYEPIGSTEVGASSTLSVEDLPPLPKEDTKPKSILETAFDNFFLERDSIIEETPLMPAQETEQVEVVASGDVNGTSSEKIPDDIPYDTMYDIPPSDTDEEFASDTYGDTYIKTTDTEEEFQSEPDMEPVSKEGTSSVWKSEYEDNTLPEIYYEGMVSRSKEIQTDAFDVLTKNDIFGIYHITTYELEHFTHSLQSEKVRSIFITQVNKDKKLMIELAKCVETSKQYFLFYSPRCHAYFSICLEEEYVLKEILKPLLQRPSIMKICYAPFFIVSTLRHLGLTIQGMHSLFVISGILFPEHSFLPTVMMELFGAIRAKGGVQFEQEGSVSSFPLAYMYAYYRIYLQMEKRLRKSGAYGEYLSQNELAETFGLCYLESYSHMGMGALFGCSKCGKYVFRPAYESNSRPTGTCYRYEFTRLPNVGRSILIELLLYLKRTGRFKKYHFNIVGVTDTSLLVFLPKDEEVYLKECIHVALLSIQDREEFHGIHYLIESI